MLASASATRAQVMRVALLVLCVPSGANAQANSGGTAATETATNGRCDVGFFMGLSVFVLFTVLFFNCIPATNPDTAETPPPPRWFSRTLMVVFGMVPVLGALWRGCAIFAAIYLLFIVGVPVYMTRMHPNKSSLLTGYREVADTIVSAPTNGIASSSDKEEPT